MTTTKEGLFIMEKEDKKVYKPFSKCKENFSKRFMLVTRFIYRGKLKVRKVTKRKRKKKNPTNVH